MSTSRDEQKTNEKWFLEAARRASSLIPDGQIHDFEEPDFKIDTTNGLLGIEVTELLRMDNDGPFLPVVEEKFHKDVMDIAAAHHRKSGAGAVDVLAYFTNDWQGRRNAIDVARSLADFVKLRYQPGDPTYTFSRFDGLPEGFTFVRVSSLGETWTCGEHGAMGLLEDEHLASIIGRKNKLITTYKKRLPNSPVWLLIYSGVSIPRHVPIPVSIHEWTFEFDFDRVLLFSSLDHRVFEIQRKLTGAQK